MSEASPQGFGACPASWYYIGSTADICARPRRFELPGGQSFVAFSSAAGAVTVLSGRCSHMSADLSRGYVKEGRIVCPLHGWEYGSDGGCRHIPAATEIPGFARQTCFPVAERSGHIFFFNRPKALFPMPFYAGVSDADLTAAEPFEFIVDAPWYLVSANGFDVQHFRSAHDRTLIGEPRFDGPDAFARRLRATFRVTGNSIFDRLTRLFSGSEVEMDIENWAGNLVLVTATFRRARSYGLVSFVPLEKNRTLVRDIVLVPRRRNKIARRFVDPLDARIRRWFIREFVRSDATRSDGIRYHPGRMIAADKLLVEYLNWLQNLHRQVAEDP